MLVLIGVILGFIGSRVFSTFRSNKKFSKVDEMGNMFKEMDASQDGSLQRSEMQNGLHILGLELNRDAANDLFDQVNVVGSGDIDEIEWVAWLRTSMSQSKTLQMDAKILIGLYQVLSRQPAILSQEASSPSRWQCLKITAFDAINIIPCVQLCYTSRFLLNVLALPIFMMGLVGLTWLTKKTEDDIGEALKEQITTLMAVHSPQNANDEEVATLVARYRDKQGQLESMLPYKYGKGLGTEQLIDPDEQNRRSDFYLAFFLVYPKMSQTCFGLFQCRQLTQNVVVLEADCSVKCYSGDDWLLSAVVSIVGLAVVSFFVPIFMSWYLRKELVKGGKRLIVAQFDFGSRYDFVVSDFRTDAYFAESVDLIRKLILSGMMVFI